MAAGQRDAIWGPIIQYLSEDPEVREWLEKDDGAEATELASFDVDYWKNWAEALAFKRFDFDVLNIIKIMIKKFTKYTASEVQYSIKEKIGNKERELSYSNRKSFASDIKMLIGLFYITGKNIDRIKHKSFDKTYSDIVKMLIAKYDIDTSKRSSLSTLEPNVVTLPRICACFPLITCQMYHKEIGKKLFTLDQIGIKAPVSSAVMTPFFCSCIPRNIVRAGEDNVNLLFFLTHILTDNLVHEKKGNYTPLTNIYDDYVAAYRSSACPEKARLLYCKRFNLLNDSSTSFVEAITNAVNGAEGRIRTLRPDDVNLDIVIENLKTLVR